MAGFVEIFKFSWPYLKRYWVRLLLGLLLGMGFGVFNASFVWGTKTLFERMEPAPDLIEQNQQGELGQGEPNWSQSLNEFMDPWLPRARFIQIIRDPRDNFALIKSGVGKYYSKLGEDEKHSLSSLIYRASIGLKICSANIGAFGEDRYMYLRHEDLCTNPRFELDRKENFLKIEKCFNLPKPTILGENVPGNNFENEKLFNIYALNVGRWTDRIIREEAQTIEFHSGDLLEEYGFERKYSNENAISSIRNNTNILITNIFSDLDLKIGKNKK